METCSVHSFIFGLLSSWTHTVALPRPFSIRCGTNTSSGETIGNINMCEFSVKALIIIEVSLSPVFTCYHNRGWDFMWLRLPDNCWDDSSNSKSELLHKGQLAWRIACTHIWFCVKKNNKCFCVSLWNFGTGSHHSVTESTLTHTES